MAIDSANYFQYVPAASDVNMGKVDVLSELREKKPHLSAYVQDITQTLHDLSIGEEEFSILRPKEQVIALAAEFLGALEMNVFFLNDPVNVLLTLGIADAYLQFIRNNDHTDREKAEKQESMLLSLGIASYETTNNVFRTYSGYMNNNFDTNLKRKKPLDQQPIVKKTTAERRVTLRTMGSYEEEHLDQEATAHFTHEAKIAGVSLQQYILDVARDLRISPEIIPAISFKLLSATKKELLNTLGIQAKTVNFTDNRRIITLPSDWDEHNVAHEVLHAVTRGFSFGNSNLVGVAINEALTEFFTHDERSYPDQVGVLNSVKEKTGAIFSRQLENAYVHGDENSRVTAMASLVREFGIQAIYQFLFLSPGITQFTVNRIGYINRIFLDPQAVKKFFTPSSFRFHSWNNLEAVILD